MLDDIDKTQIGRYGTISLLKRQDPPTVVTSFGIDTEELTFGRDRDCSIRLYYADIDSIHCKIVFEDRKAFLIVLGKNGLLVDGCLVYPNSAVHGAQTTIPLTNNSEIEIHNKRFRFTYPPKELRAMLFASPIRPTRAPRLSMIHSAQVFSPKLPKNFEGNLRLLQSPLKSTFLRSPLKGSNHVSNGNQDRSKPTYDQSSGHDWISDDEEGCEEIVLVEGDNPRVVEEEKDLVIVENVEVPPPSTSFESAFSPGPHNEHRLHLSIVDPLQTPHRCRNSRDSLHRAVLIRSAQRAVLHAEKEEDELEEMEVLSVVASDDDEDEIVDETDSNRGMDVWNEEPTSEQALKPMPRNAERTQSLQDLSTVVESAEQDPLLPLKLCEDLQWKQGDIEGGQNEGTQSLASANSTNLATCYESIDKCKYLGDFRTPQPQSRRQFQKPLGRSLFAFKKESSGDASRVLDDPTSNSPGRARYSIASGEPRRMLIEMPWRVEDLVVPAKSEEHRVVSPRDITHEVHSTESNSQLNIAYSVTPSSARRGVDERERKAIRERRRSALREMDSFFAGGIPGMGSTPTKNTAVPYRRDQSLYDTPKRNFVPSLEENVVTLTSRKASDKSTVKSEDDEELDTQILLERMKVTVEEMRRRRSTVFTPPPSLMQRREPPLSNNAAPVASPDVRMQVENSREQHPMDQTEEPREQQPFSLLRPPKVVIEPLQDENESRSMEKSFSQLMRSESPEDLEQPSEDICHILEQDITIPSENAENPTCDITGSNPYTVHRSTRSRTASAEPETNLLAWERDTVHNDTHIQQLNLVPSGRPAKDTRKGPRGDRAPAPSAAQLRGRNCRKPQQKTTIESRISSSDSEKQEMPNTESEDEEDKRESTPTPAPRTMRTSRRGVGVASVANSGQLQDKAEDPEQIPPNASNRRLKRSTAVDPNSDAKRKSRKAKKEDQGTSEVEGTRKTRTRSATVNGSASRTTNASKTPATRSGGRKTPVTAPSAIPVDCEDEKPNGGKENSKVTPADGTRVRISRNKATSNTATVSRVKAEGVSAVQRVTRTRTRART
ncbi:hypothetical protein JOM56_001294 [Amanita muscaria]